ncbi:MAG: glycosyltransferase family 9 protein [Bacteroidales bacterium]|jgi:ADP-heptose:LPS heptosyltransferase|nr:glycosyltransferase family 9 protein [Bacteroidales bacterium]
MLNSENSINKPAILISRTDGIGDVVLTLPVANMLKKKFPQSLILFLGRNYTKPVIECCEDIDRFLSWDMLQKMPENEQISALKQEKIDAILHIFPQKAIARLAYKAKIPQRFGTSHRIYNLLYCNHLLHFSRRHSDLHEAQLNLQLLKPLIPDFVTPSINELSQYLKFKNITPNPYSNLLESNKFNLILHPKSKGSAREWDITNYCRLISLLPEDKFKIFVCGTQEEGNQIRSQLIEPYQERIEDLTGKCTLSQYIALIAEADGLIAASTGPLHISAIQNKHSIGLFPPIRPMNPQRWQPVGDKVKVFCANKECEICRKTGQCKCMQSITPEEIANYLISNCLNDL